MMITTLIMDSKWTRAQVIDRYLRSMPEVEHRGVVEEAKTSLAYMDSGLYTLDVVFLDASLLSESLIALVHKLSDRTLFIITSEQEADKNQAYHCQAISFLLHPVSLEDFTVAVHKAMLYLANRHPMNSYFFIREAIGGTRIRIDISKIAFLETMENYVKIFYSKDTHCLIYSSLHRLLENMPARLFLRISQSIAVPIASITSYDTNWVYLSSDLDFKIGKSYKKKVLAILGTKEVKLRK